MVYSLNVIHKYHRVVAVPIEGDFSKVKLVDDTYDGGDIPAAGGGRRVRTELVPKRMRWTNGGKRKIPDFERSGSHIGISERVKLLIERFEPGVHQFVPADYFSGKGELLERRYILYVCNRIDSLDHGKTSFVLKTTYVLPEYVKPGKEWSRSWTSVSDMVRWDKSDLIPPHLPHDAKSEFVFNRAQIGAVHLWCDKFFGGVLWLSDELAQAIRDSDLTGVNLDEAHRREAV
jgi:hypothetical protein